MKRGDRITVQVEQLSPKGDGIARFDEREIVIPRTVPGDYVEVYLKRKRRGRFEGAVDSLLQSRYERQDPPCSHFGTCGGCRWQDIGYSDQLRIKEQAVLDALAQHDVQAREVDPILASPVALFYRNKMEFSFGTDRESKMELGLHVRGRFNRIFNVDSCHLQSELSNRIVQTVRSNAQALGLSVYDLKTHEGLLRFLVIRHGDNSDQTMVNLVVSEFPSEKVDALVSRVIKEVGEIDTFIVTLHQGKAQVAVGQQEFVLKGEGKIRAQCVGLDFELSAQSFFQPNIAQAEQLYGIIMERAGDIEGCEVLDLYCGSGAISLQLARLANKVYGIELASEAVEDAWSNARNNGIENVEFLVAPAEEALGQLQSSGLNFDLVVADPPRVGLHKRVRVALVELGPPKIIYVSCNPYTLAEDLRYLVDGGYILKRMQPVDMFPQTPHCEVVAELATF